MINTWSVTLLLHYIAHVYVVTNSLKLKNSKTNKDDGFYKIYTNTTSSYTLALSIDKANVGTKYTTKI